MVIMGIDPGLAIMGYGVIEYTPQKTQLIDFGVVQTAAGLKLPERLDIISESMAVLYERFSPGAVAFEELFFARNVTTAIAVAQARGAAVASIYKNTHELYEYTPTQVKQAVVGYGRADKNQVQMMVKTILGLEKIPKPDDAADAVAIAICHAHSMNFKRSFSM